MAGCKRTRVWDLVPNSITGESHTGSERWFSYLNEEVRSHRRASFLHHLLTPWFLPWKVELVYFQIVSVNQNVSHTYFRSLQASFLCSGQVRFGKASVNVYNNWPIINSWWNFTFPELMSPRTYLLTENLECSRCSGGSCCCVVLKVNVKLQHLLGARVASSYGQ